MVGVAAAFLVAASFDAGPYEGTVRDRDGGGLLFCRIIELVLSRSAEAVQDAAISPQFFDSCTNLRGQAFAFDLRGLHEDGLNVILCPLIVER